MKKLVKPDLIFAVLARVSTRDQKDGQSLAMQVDLGRDYARRAGATDVLIYQGVESATGEKRDILEGALADAEAGKFHALVVQEMTRLSRNPGVMFISVSRLNKAGVALHDLNGPISFDSPEGELKAMIEAIIGRFTARRGVQKSIDARSRVLASGRPAAGRPPWGRKWDRGDACYVLIEEKRRQLERVYKLIVKQRTSANRAAAMVKLAPSSLRKAIRQSSLTEVVQRLGRREFKFKCLPILTDRQHGQLESAIAANTVIRPGTKGRYLLQGLVRCASCSAAMTGQTSTKDDKRYSIYRHPPSTYKPGCVWQVPVSMLDDDVLIACANVVHDSESLRAAVEQALTQTDAGAANLKQRLSGIQEEIKQVGSRWVRTLDRLVAFEEGTESRKLLEKRAKADEFRLAEIKVEHGELLKQASFLQLSREDAELAVAKVRSLYWGSGAGTKVLSFEQQQDFVRTIIGRSKREEGIFVSMTRPISGSKKDVSWKYSIEGALMLAANRIGRKVEFSPELIESRPFVDEQVKRLAAISGASPGVTLLQRPYHMQMRPKSRSPACM